MKSKEQIKQPLFCLMFEAVIEIPGQPATPTTAELADSVPSQYAKFTEYQKKFYQVEWSNPQLDPEVVYKTYLRALKRKVKIVRSQMIDPGLMLTQPEAS